MDDPERGVATGEGLGRRAFLTGLAAVPIALSARGLAARAGEAGPGMVVREQEPQNLESPFSFLEGFLTPVDQFYVRNHFPVPELTAETWALEVGGAVERPFRISYQELRGMTARTTPATLECAGNGRVFLAPKEKGAQWGQGAVGNAEWTGVPLSALLERAGVRPGAVEVVFEGADQGELKDDPKSPGPIRFARSLPMAKVRGDTILLAHKMNGAALTPAHGFPVRAVVPGWYGMASVKWLAKVTVADRPFLGFFQSLDYTHWERQGGQPSLVPIGELQVKAQVARPALKEVVAAGRPYLVRGAAWTGEAEIAGVEVSTDGGRSWSAARLAGEPIRHAWRLWEFSWEDPRPGSTTIMARAVDSLGHWQPTRRDRDRRNYMISHVVPVAVEVR